MTEQTGNNKPNEAERLGFTLSGNEKLIEEAYRQGRSDERYSLAYAPPVFEKTLGEATLTPTDDEREALARAWDAGHRKGIRWKRGDAPENPYRSEVPEPSAEPGWSHPEAMYSPEVFMEIQGLLNEAQGSPMHALRLAVSRQMSEPQGEPSDAAIRNHGGWDMELQSKSYPPDSAVSAALTAWNVTGGSDRVAMRAALRAAGGVFEKAHTPKERWASGVEPSDAYVLAALNRYYVPDGKPAQSLSDWSEGAVRAMRAVLRGDFEDGGE